MYELSDTKWALFLEGQCILLWLGDDIGDTVFFPVMRLRYFWHMPKPSWKSLIRSDHVQRRNMIFMIFVIAVNAFYLLQKSPHWYLFCGDLTASWKGVNFSLQKGLQWNFILTSLSYLFIKNWFLGLFIMNCFYIDPANYCFSRLKLIDPGSSLVWNSTVFRSRHSY